MVKSERVAASTNANMPIARDTPELSRYPTKGIHDMAAISGLNNHQMPTHNRQKPTIRNIVVLVWLSSSSFLMKSSLEIGSSLISDTVSGYKPWKHLSMSAVQGQQAQSTHTVSSSGSLLAPHGTSTFFGFHFLNVNYYP